MSLVQKSMCLHSLQQWPTGGLQTVTDFPEIRNILFKPSWYFLQSTVQNYSTVFPRALCHFPELLGILSVLLAFFIVPFLTSIKEQRRQQMIVSLGSYNTDWCLSWSLMVWRQEDLDVLNNKIPQTDNERQLWKRQRRSLDVLTTVLQGGRKISMSLCEAFLLSSQG